MRYEPRFFLDGGETSVTTSRGFQVTMVVVDEGYVTRMSYLLKVQAETFKV